MSFKVDQLPVSREALVPDTDSTIFDRSIDSLLSSAIGSPDSPASVQFPLDSDEMAFANMVQHRQASDVPVMEDAADFCVTTAAKRSRTAGEASGDEEMEGETQPDKELLERHVAAGSRPAKPKNPPPPAVTQDPNMASLMAMMTKSMQDADARHTTQLRATREVKDSLHEISEGLQQVRGEVVDLTKEVRENKAELQEQIDVLKEKFDKGSTAAPSTSCYSMDDERFTPQYFEMRNFCVPQESRTDGATLIEVKAFLTSALADPVGEGLPEDVLEKLMRGIHMKFKKAYCVMVNLCLELQPFADLLVTVLSTYAADHLFRGVRGIFVQLQLAPKEEAKKM